jgi:hypothetical protein
LKGLIEMSKKSSKLIFSMLALLALFMVSAQIGGSVIAQNLTAQTNNALAQLPQSDAVLLVEMRRVLNDALPRALGDSPRMAEINADIDRFRQRTGVNPRDFERIAVGASYVTTASGATRMEPVAIATGSFNAGQIVAAGRLATNGRYREERYQGRTIYVFTLNEQVRLLGLLNTQIREVAVAELSPTALAIGNLGRVRAAIDTATGRGTRVSPEITALVTRNAGALASFGGNIPANATRGLDTGNEELDRTIASIRQVYGHVGQTASGFDMLATMRAGTADQARVLNDNLNALRPIASFAVGQMSGRQEALGRLARNSLESLRITQQANEVSVNFQVAQSDLATAIRGL